MPGDAWRCRGHKKIHLGAPPASTGTSGTPAGLSGRTPEVPMASAGTSGAHGSSGNTPDHPVAPTRTSDVASAAPIFTVPHTTVPTTSANQGRSVNLGTASTEYYPEPEIQGSVPPHTLVAYNPEVPPKWDRQGQNVGSGSNVWLYVAE